jgi:MoaA/NifB/PqqE/SkfB family radical SAM enzyme
MKREQGKAGARADSGASAGASGGSGGVAAPAAPPASLCGDMPANIDWERVAARMETSVEANNILRELDLTFIADRMLAMPSRYYAAVSVVCDIVCPFCPRQYHGELVDNGVMSYDSFAAMAPGMKFSDFAGLFGLGEPFLHKDFLNFIRSAKRAGAWTTTSSHGMSLTEEMCHKVIDEGLDDISVSMDGPDKKTFELLRAGAHYETVCANLKRFAEIKKERGVEKPGIQIACTVSRHNVEKLGDMPRFAKELGAYQLVFSDLIIINPDNGHLSVWNTPLFQKNLEKAKKAGAKLGFPVHYFHQKPFPWLKDMWPADANGKRYGCYEAWKTFSLERRGEVKPCCYLERPVGNAFETPAEELRNSDEYVGLRRELMEGRPNEFCQNCGNLRLVHADHVKTHLANARKMLDESTTLPDAERATLRAVYAAYEERAREEFGAEV